MPTRVRTHLASAFLVLASVSCGSPERDGRAVTGEILADLRAVPEVTSVTEAAPAASVPAGYRLFRIQLRQPVDHAAPGGAAFGQRATLLFRDHAAPVVFATNGYSASMNPGLSEPAALLEANQLTVEHRFFAGSTPVPVDWSKLDIRQSASDLHRVVRALRPILAGRWLSAGASKGGMTAVFHRRFFPDDVDATLAYVAPLSFGTTDPRYVEFLGTVGDEACRDAVQAAQQALVTRRADVEPLLAGEGDLFHTFGLSRTYEYAVLELAFGFWQYGDVPCSEVPGPGASPEELYAFLARTYGGLVASLLGDDAIAFFTPYFFQSATELGGPAYPQDHLTALVGHPIVDVPEDYPPFDVEKPFDATAMADVDAWVRSEGERILFLYGEVDPWSAGMMTPAPGRDAARYVVAGGNHRSVLSDLPPGERAAALATLRRWLSIPESAALEAEPAFDRGALLDGSPGYRRR